MKKEATKKNKFRNLEEGLARLVAIQNRGRVAKKKPVESKLPPELGSKMWSFIEEANSDMRQLFVENEEKITSRKMREAIRDFLGDRFYSMEWDDETNKEFDKLCKSLAKRAYP